MSKNKQSSVEWFQEQIIKIVNGTCLLSEIEIFEQAKAMHKEEIIEAYCTGCLHMAEDETIFPRETSERYYETTYGNPPPPKPHIPFIYR